MEQTTLRVLKRTPKKQEENWSKKGYLENMIQCLESDLNFQENGSDFHPAHKIHSFPAKFPPQLPRKFITNLTRPGEIVLDPMMGSGTCLLEAFFLGRQAIGIDIDPLAILLSTVKKQIYETSTLYAVAKNIISEATNAISKSPHTVFTNRENYFDADSCDFLDYWFSKEVQIELLALLIQINKITDSKLNNFFKLIFSSVIITKTGGVSLAIDLAHTRPHRARTVFAQDGQVILGEDNGSQNKKYLTKKLRSPIEEFRKKAETNIKSLLTTYPSNALPIISFGNSKTLPIASNSIDLIVTSPPYASNAIDYMRAHKFSLIWFGYSVNELAKKRKAYIGSEGIYTGDSVELPPNVEAVISRVRKTSTSKANSLHRYYSEMSLSIKEMYRVLKPGKASIVVVGNSILSGEDARIEECLAAIGNNLGFEIPKIGIRQLDRNRRMLPIGTNHDISSQIQQRMQEEYIIGFYKPY